MAEWHEDQADALGECDLIMKGGVASGVIYPRAVARLGQEYRLRNIGGASAGAIAAAGAAAAEYRRRRTGSGDGYRRLQNLHEELAAPTGVDGELRLAALFQPDPALQQHHAAAMAAREHWAQGNKMAAVLAAPDPGSVPPALPLPSAVRWAMVAVAAGLAALLAGTSYALWVLAAGAGAVLRALLAMAPWLLALGAVLLAARFVPRVTLAARRWLAAVRSARGLFEANFIGLVNGHDPGFADVDPPADATRPMLTDWLHCLIQDISGMSADQVLTFGDLWAADEGDHDWDRRVEEHRPFQIRPDGRPGERTVDLQVISLCLTLATPYRMPYGMRRFWFNPVELRRLFPKSVVDHMELTGAAEMARREHVGAPTLPDGTDGTLVAWPHAADVPVVVAARMSLSVPGFISAIPLWAVDPRWEFNAGVTESDKSALQAERVWFSDGGMGSNFPIHLFDSPLPKRPTFGIDLRPFHPGQTPAKGADEQAANCQMVEDYADPVEAFWRRIDRSPTARPTPPRTIADVSGPPDILQLANICIDAMKHWRDDALMRVPGYRERIVHILQAGDEGGFNLDMDGKRIMLLARRGEAGAQLLIDHFKNDPPDDARNGWVTWNAHRWTRLRSSLGAIEDLLRSVEQGYEADPPDGWSYPELIRSGPPEGVPANYRWTGGQTEAVEAYAQAVLDAVTAWLTATGDPAGQSSLAFGAPIPPPRLRIQPEV